MDPTVTAAAIGVGGTVIVGVAGFWASVRNTSKTTALALRAVELTEQGQVTDRYTKAIGQLGSDKLDVRIGAIYALERIARDSPRDHPAVMDVLSAFIREHSREPWPVHDPQPGAKSGPEPETRPDIQAAVTVLVRRDWSNDKEPIDLAGARLPSADLSEGHFRNATMTGADLTEADLSDADLSGASLVGAELHVAVLVRAKLTNAVLNAANLQAAILDNADFSGADLTDVILQETDTPPTGWVRSAQTGELRRAPGLP
jgi:hypothetical protein